MPVVLFTWHVSEYPVFHGRKRVRPVGTKVIIRWFVKQSVHGLVAFVFENQIERHPEMYRA